MAEQETFLLAELNWLRNIFQVRLKHQFNKAIEAGEDISESPPEIPDNAGIYGEFVRENKLGFEERLILILALAPHIYPNFIDDVISGVVNIQGDFPQLGGMRGKSFRGFIPTLETVLFILAGDDLKKRFSIQRLFREDHLFIRKNILYIDQLYPEEPFASGNLVIDSEYAELFTLGTVSKPRFSRNFPAQLITTELVWSDLVLSEQTAKQIKELETWVEYNDTLLNKWGMHKRLTPGYRVLFYGPPGTGKTLTASLLGKYTGREVYRIDLSLVISKFIGETEKNLASLFDKARNKNWILFFDEADALFGKRTNIRDAHDKYANQEVSYLLQRVETHPGLVILASNFKSNIDEAFTRRFQSIVNYPMPRTDERLLLWQKSLPGEVKLAEEVDLRTIAGRYELTGANIVNIVQYICLQVLSRNEHTVDNDLLLEGIKREYQKEGKIV